MPRSVQDLALSMDPNIKIEPEVEDVLQLLSSTLTLPASFLLLHSSSATSDITVTVDTTNK
jgi:hypothetical protein